MMCKDTCSVPRVCLYPRGHTFPGTAQSGNMICCYLAYLCSALILVKPLLRFFRSSPSPSTTTDVVLSDIPKIAPLCLCLSTTITIFPLCNHTTWYELFRHWHWYLWFGHHELLSGYDVLAVVRSRCCTARISLSATWSRRPSRIYKFSWLPNFWWTVDTAPFLSAPWPFLRVMSGDVTVLFK